MEKRKVLLVDKIKAIIEKEKSALSRMGLTVLDAGTGEEALELIYKEKPDLVVLDYIMPKVTGVSICEKIKADDDLKDTKVIMICMLGRESDKRKCLDAGCDDTLLKPFSRSDLLGKIQHHLGISARKYKRLTLVAKTEISIESAGIIRNISEGGLFIETKKLHTPGTVIKVKFSLPDYPSPIETKAEVMWIKKGEDGPGAMGVRFINLSEEAKAAVCEYCK